MNPIPKIPIKSTSNPWLRCPPPTLFDKVGSGVGSARVGITGGRPGISVMPTVGDGFDGLMGSGLGVQVVIRAMVDTGESVIDSVFGMLSVIGVIVAVGEGVTVVDTGAVVINVVVVVAEMMVVSGAAALTNSVS